MSSRHRVRLSPRPARDPEAEAWIRNGGDAPTTSPGKMDLYTARLTIDVKPELRGRIKVTAFERCITVAEMLRELLEREYGDEASAGDD